MWRGKDLGLSNIVQHKLLQSILKTNVRLSLQHLRFGLNWQVTTEWVKKEKNQDAAKDRSKSRPYVEIEVIKIL